MEVGKKFYGWQARDIVEKSDAAISRPKVPESPSPNTAAVTAASESGGRLFRSKNFHSCFMLSGVSPWPVVEATNTMAGSVGS